MNEREAYKIERETTKAFRALCDWVGFDRANQLFERGGFFVDETWSMKATEAWELADDFRPAQRLAA